MSRHSKPYTRKSFLSHELTVLTTTRAARVEFGARLAAIVPMLILLAGTTDHAANTYGQTSVAEANTKTEILVDMANTGKVLRYCGRIIEKYDANRDGHLAPEEWKPMRGEPASVDHDLDNRITLEELARHVADYGLERRIRRRRHVIEGVGDIEPLLHPTTEAETRDLADEETPGERGPNGTKPPGERSSSVVPETSFDEEAATYRRKRFQVGTSRLPSGLPPWFAQRDTNGDGQLTLAEFAPRPNRSLLTRFSAYDINRDGLLTPREYLRSTMTREADIP